VPIFVAAAFPREHRTGVRRYFHAQDDEKVTTIVRGLLVQEFGLVTGPGYKRRAQTAFVRALRVPRVAVTVHDALARQVRPVPYVLLRPEYNRHNY